MLYIPEEGGAPHSVTVPCDYDTSVLLGGVGTNGDASSVVCRVFTSPENVFCRVTAPRKLQLRCRLGSRITALSASEAESGGDAPTGLEIKRGGVEAMALYSGASRDLLCSSSLEGLPEGAEPILCRAFVNVSECRPVSAGEYRCRGDVVIECVYKKDGSLGTLTERVGFDETVAIDGDISSGGPDETSPVRASGTVTSAELHTDDSGSRVEVVYALEVETVTPFTADVVYDAYSCVSPASVEYDDTEFLSPAVCASANVTLSERVPKNTVGRVVTSTARADIGGASSERGKLRVSGELRGASLILSDGEYDVVPFSLPWECEMPASVPEGAETTVWGCACVPSLSVRADGELTVDAEITVSATAACVRRERVLSSVTAAGEPFPPRCGFTVYYPSKDETVWDIAKRFHVPCASVASEGNVNSDGTPASVVVI